MTSTTGTTGHPDATELSDLAEGLLTPSRGADVRRHLDTCDLCTEVHASLEEIRFLLGTLPKPDRMPDDVAQRIDAALAAETPFGAGADSDAACVSRETPTTGADRSSGHPRAATTGPGRKDPLSGTERRRRGRRRAAVLAALCGVAALGLGAVLVFSFNGDDSDTTVDRRSTAADTFARGTLEKKVTDLLAKTDNSDKVQPFDAGGEPGSPEPKVLETPAVPACVQQGLGRDDAALATERGTYQGKDALLVVLPDTSDSARVDAYVMDRSCATRSSSDPAKILLRHSYARH